MPAIPTADLVARLRAAADPAAADRELLRAFLADRSEPAFAALVRRHGPMVLGVCRRVLGDAHDADDAFQATFLVLARRAAAVGRPDRLPGWLHTIAVRTATEIRRMRDRRRRLEQASGRRQSAECESRSPEQCELAAALDEELAKLPEHYRTPVLLCELQGLSRKEAAARLKLPEGTLSSRLAKARKLLADRLACRGVTATAAAITAILAREASARVPAGLATEAARVAAAAAGHAAGSASAAAVHAADGVVKALLVGKLKGLACALGVVAACAGGVATLPGGFGSAAGGAGQPGTAEIGTDADARELVKQLGSPSFADREAAERKLRALGAKARPALVTGTKNPDPETARRCEAVLKRIREDERHAGPAWTRFKELVGDTEASRKLFAEMTADDRRAEALDKAAADPAEAARLYAADVARVEEAWKKATAPLFDARGLGSDSPEARDKMREVSRKAVPPSDLTAILFLGSFPLPDSVPDPSALVSLFKYSFIDLARGPLKEPFRKLFVAWLDQRRDAKAVRIGMDAALQAGIGEAAPVARRLATNPKLDGPALGTALLVIGNHGRRDDVPLLATFRADARAYWDYPKTEAGPYQEQVRDVAAAMALRLCFQDFEKFGFEAAEFIMPWTSPEPAPYVSIHGGKFIDNAVREAAHKKAWEWIDAQPKPAPKEKPDPEAEKLVKQLGSPAFAERDAAEKKLKELGPKARSAVLAGTKHADPEVARRAAVVLDHIRAAERAEFARSFRDGKDGPLAIDHPVWNRFKRITGDTKEARALFAAVIADDARFRRLEEAEEKPTEAGRLYAAQFPRPDETIPVNLATAFLLGTYPGTAAKLPNRQEEMLADWNGLVLPLNGPEAGPLRKLYAAWLGARTDPDVLAAGLEIARVHNLEECLPLARRLAADPKVVLRSRADALLVVGQFGTPDDVPLARPLLTETARYGTFLAGDPSRAQVKDIAAAVMLMAQGQKPWEFGFKCGLRETKVPGKHKQCVFVYGFPSEEARASGHKAVLAYVEAAEKKAAAAKPEPAAPVEKPADLKQFLADFRADADGTKDFDHPLWRRFTAAAGKDKSARVLFAALVADPDRADRLAAAAADPMSAGKLYEAEVERVRKYADEFNAEFVKKFADIKDPLERLKATQKYLAEIDPPVGEVAAMLLLGTFPASADLSLGDPGPKRVSLDSVPTGLPISPADKFAWAPATRRLFVAWLATRTITEDKIDGLKKAGMSGLAEPLPLARRWAADPLQPPKVRGLALPIIARFGTAADRPLADALHDNVTYLSGMVIQGKSPDPADPNKRTVYQATVGDVALAVNVHLAGGNPFEFGFGPPGRKPPDAYVWAWGSLSHFGFADEDARREAHRKAKEWLKAHPER
jgi:RNA polymerase sigma factor (sigma-70 family)